MASQGCTLSTKPTSRPNDTCEESPAKPAYLFLKKVLDAKVDATITTPQQANTRALPQGLLGPQRCMLSAWPLARRWQSQVHLVFIASSSVAACLDAQTVLVRSVPTLTANATLSQAELGLLSHRRFHVMVPELQRLQLSAIFRYLSKQGTVGRLRGRAHKFKLSALSQRLQGVHYGLLKPLKFRSTRAINFRKNFVRLRRLYFERLRTSFFFGRIRPQKAKRLLSRFANKRNLALNLLFSLNPHKLVCRVFPFMDRFLLRAFIRRW